MAAASRFQTLSLHTLRMLFFFFIFSFSFISWAAESYASEDDPQYTNCSLPVTCGPLTTINVTYPFWGNGRADYCGVEGFKLGCQDDGYAFMDFKGQRYTVLEIDQNNYVMTVAREDLWWNPCPKGTFRNTTMDNNTLFDYPMDVKNVSIFYCPNHVQDLDPSKSLGEIPCPADSHPGVTAILIEDEVRGSEFPELAERNQCNVIKVPVLQSALDEYKKNLVSKPDDLWKVLKRGFELVYTVDQICSRCASSGGICGTNSYSPQNFTCYCSDKPHSSICLPPAGMPIAPGLSPVALRDPFVHLETLGKGKS